MNKPNKSGKSDGATAAVDGVKNVADKVSNVATGAVAAIRDEHEHLADQARQSYGDAYDATFTLANDVREYVRDQPIKSVLLAAGAGYILGRLRAIL